jgi:hypothetical protein
MKMAVFSVVFAVLASGCALGAEGPEDCSGSCNQASFELSESDKVKLAGTWTAADGTKSMEIGKNGYCQLDNVPCSYTVRATAPTSDYDVAPWLVDLELETGEVVIFEVELIDADTFTAKHGDTFVDFIKTGGSPIPTKSEALHPEKPGDATFDDIVPIGRHPGGHYN